MSGARRAAPRASSAGGWLLAILLSLAAGGCAATDMLRPRDDRTDEVAALKARIVELQKQVTVHEVELTRLRERLAALEGGGAGRRSEPAAAARAEPPPRQEVRPAPRQEPAPPVANPSPPRGRAEAADLETYDLDVPPPVTPPSPPAATAPPARAAADRPAATESPAHGLPVDAAGQALYDQGYALFHQGRYVDSEAAFQRFLATYENSELADNAGYWIGEARYAREDYRGALAAFREAIERHPEGNKVPDSLLKIGRCLEQLGDLGGARETYSELIRIYPGSGAAAIAEERRSALP